MNKIENMNIDEAFPETVGICPKITLRGGNDIDSYKEATPYDDEIDNPNDEYLENYSYWGCNYLDYESWKYYVPILLKYSLSHYNNAKSDMVIDALLNSIRPPKENIYKLKTENIVQYNIVMGALDVIAFSGEYSNAEYAMQVVQEIIDKWGV